MAEAQVLALPGSEERENSEPKEGRINSEKKSCPHQLQKCLALEMGTHSGLTHDAHVHQNLKHQNFDLCSLALHCLVLPCMIQG